jgi:threonine-phosphate decarboxylase
MIAQAAGTAALADTAYEERLRMLTARESAYMREALEARGFLVIPGRTNYILFYSEDHALHNKLLDCGIMIRDCSDYPGLTEGWYRVAVRTREKNEMLLSHLPPAHR